MRINAIQLSFQISRTTPAMMATTTSTTTKKTADCHNIWFVDTCPTAGVVVTDDDGEKDVNGKVEGDDMTRESGWIVKRR